MIDEAQMCIDEEYNSAHRRVRTMLSNTEVEQLEEGDVCPVCIMPLNTPLMPLVLLPCGHAAHAECISTWVVSQMTRGTDIVINRCPYKCTDAQVVVESDNDTAASDAGGTAASETTPTMTGMITIGLSMAALLSAIIYLAYEMSSPP